MRLAKRRRVGPDDPVAVVTRFLDAANHHDADGLRACVHPEFESHQPLHPVRNFRGPGQLVSNWKAIFEAEPGFRLTLLRASTTGNTVWAEVHGAGASAEAAGVFIIGVEDGRIRWIRVYSDLVEPLPEEPIAEEAAAPTETPFWDRDPIRLVGEGRRPAGAAAEPTTEEVAEADLKEGVALVSEASTGGGGDEESAVPGLRLVSGLDAPAAEAESDPDSEWAPLSPAVDDVEPADGGEAAPDGGSIEVLVGGSESPPASPTVVAVGDADTDVVAEPLLDDEAVFEDPAGDAAAFVDDVDVDSEEEDDDGVDDDRPWWPAPVAEGDDGEEAIDDEEIDQADTANEGRRRLGGILRRGRVRN